MRKGRNSTSRLKRPGSVRQPRRGPNESGNGGPVGPPLRLGNVVTWLGSGRVLDELLGNGIGQRDAPKAGKVAVEASLNCSNRGVHRLDRLLPGRPHPEALEVAFP